MLSSALSSVWFLENLSDWLIAAAYFSIPVQLLFFLQRMPIPLDRKSKLIVTLFAAFILLCGLTHALHAWLMILVVHAGDRLTLTITHASDGAADAAAIHRLNSTLIVTKVLTAFVSLITCAALFALIPLILEHIRYVAELEEDMKRKIVELGEAQTKAETANARKGEFMAFLCHEIRNPLHVITANVDFLLETSQPCTEQQSERVDLSSSTVNNSENDEVSKQFLQSTNSSINSTTAPTPVPSTPSFIEPSDTSTCVFVSPRSLQQGGSTQMRLFDIPSEVTSRAHSRMSSLNPPSDTFDTATLTSLSSLSHTPTLEAPTHNKRHTWPSPVSIPRSVTNISSALKPSLTIEQRQYLKNINHAAELMVTLCNDVLDIAKLESGVLTFEHLAVDLPLLCETFINLCLPQANAKNIKLSLVWDEPPLKSRFVFCDPTRLHQIFLQIISNAIKFSKGQDTTKQEEQKENQLHQQQSNTTACTITSNRVTVFNSDGCKQLRSAMPRFPPRISSGFGSGGQIQFRVRAYTPTKAELEAIESRCDLPSTNQPYPPSQDEVAATRAAQQQQQQQQPYETMLNHQGLPSIAASSTPSHSSPSPSPITSPSSQPSTPFSPNFRTFRHMPRDRAQSSTNSPGLPGRHLTTQPMNASFSKLYAASKSSSRSSTSSTSAASTPQTIASPSGPARTLPTSSDTSSISLTKLPSSHTHSSMTHPSHAYSISDSAPLLTSPPPQLDYGMRRNDETSANSSDGDATDEEEERRHLMQTTADVNFSPSPSSSPASKPIKRRGAPSSSITHHSPPASSPSHTISITEGSSERTGTMSDPPLEYVWVEFLIIDNGCGMSHSSLQNIFTPYSENKLKTYRSKGGTGLGLAIVREVVIQLGGDIVATSVEGEGSIFSVRMRFQQALPEDVLETYGTIQEMNENVTLTNYESNDSTSSAAVTIGDPSQPQNSQIPVHSQAAFNEAMNSSFFSPPPPSTFVLPNSPSINEATSNNEPNTVISLTAIPPNSVTPSNLHMTASTLTGQPSSAISSSSHSSSAASSLIPLHPSSTSSRVNIPVLNFESGLIISPVQQTPTPVELASSSVGSPLSTTITPISSSTPIGSPGFRSHGSSTHRVLIVDDNEINRKLLSRMMTSLAYDVDMAEDGSVAVECVKKNMEMYPQPIPSSSLSSSSTAAAPLSASSSISSPSVITPHITTEDQKLMRMYEENRYVCIFMDISMPVMDGYEATRRIRQLGYTAPIIALTANALTEERSKAFDAGMSDHFLKPIRKNEIALLMKNYCPTHDTGVTSKSTPSSAAASSLPGAPSTIGVRQRSSPHPISSLGYPTQPHSHSFADSSSSSTQDGLAVVAAAASSSTAVASSSDASVKPSSRLRAASGDSSARRKRHSHIDTSRGSVRGIGETAVQLIEQQPIVPSRNNTTSDSDNLL